MIRSQIVAGTVGVFCLFAAGSAHAMDASPTAGHSSAGLLFGYGFKDGVGLGFGARGGFTLPSNLYVGGTFVYHLGKTESTPIGDLKYNIYYFGAEGGYDLAAGPVVLRPYLGVGYATLAASIAGLSASSSAVALWPGVTALYPIGNLSVGGDARFLITGSTSNGDGTSNGYSHLGLFATAAYQF